MEAEEAVPAEAVEVAGKGSPAALHLLFASSRRFVRRVVCRHMHYRNSSRLTAITAMPAMSPYTAR